MSNLRTILDTILAYDFCPSSKIIAQKRLLDVCMIFEKCDTILSVIFKVMPLSAFASYHDFHIINTCTITIANNDNHQRWRLLVAFSSICSAIVVMQLFCVPNTDYCTTQASTGIDATEFDSYFSPNYEK